MKRSVAGSVPSPSPFCSRERPTGSFADCSQNKSLLDYFGQYRAKLAVGAICLAATNALALALPFILGAAINRLRTHALDGIGTLALVLILVALLQAAVRIVSRLLIFNVGRDIEFDLRNDLLAHLAIQAPSYFRVTSVGDLMNRAVQDLSNVRMLVAVGFLNIVNTALAYIFALTWLISISPDLTLLALVPYPIVLLAVRRTTRALYERTRAQQERMSSLSSRAQENLTGMRVVQGFDRGVTETAAFASLSAGVRDEGLKLARARSRLWPIMGSLAGIGTALVLIAGGMRVAAGTLSLGDFVAFNGTLAILAWPTLALGWILAVWQRGMASWRRLAEIFAAVPTLADAPSSMPIRNVRGAVRAQNLCVQLGTTTALRGVSFDIAAGEWIGVTGPVGGGKSTLVLALARLSEIPAGALFIDDTDVTTATLASIRAAVKIAAQEPFLFSASIRDNIVFGKHDATSDDVAIAVTASALERDVAGFPDGLETVIGERGVQLSGGQRQRIAIARALLANPAILIIDDSLSGVDVETERRILASMRQVRRARTTILISHRLVALSACDRTMVFDGGVLTGFDTHDKLCALHPYYADLVHREELASAVESVAAVGHP